MVTSRGPELPTLPESYALRPWYHDFSRLGMRTRFEDSRPAAVRTLLSIGRAALARVRRGGIEKGERVLSRRHFSNSVSSHFGNQSAKEAGLQPLIDEALANHEAPECLDLFCADGYYGLTIASMRPSALVTGVDLDPAEIERATTAARVLGIDRARFVQADAVRFLERQTGRYDFVLCTGGLYHLYDPVKLLRRLPSVVKSFIVIQSVVSLGKREASYFESPAPGWRHGCRFSHARLKSWLEETGFDIVREEQSELPANRRASDRGSSFFLCRPA